MTEPLKFRQVGGAEIRRTIRAHLQLFCKLEIIALSNCVKRQVEKEQRGAGEMAQWVRAPTVLPKGHEFKS